MKLGLIGAGNMATAILHGVVSKGFLLKDDISVYDIDPAQIEKAQADFPGIQKADGTIALVKSCDAVILAVKPNYLEPVLREIRPYAHGRRIISIAAGWSFAMLSDILDAESGAQVLRVMPNTPAMVGEGFTALCEETSFDAPAMEWAVKLFQTLGEACVVPERLMSAVIAVSGSSPAYVYMFIEAMADGAVKLGMPRAMAYRAAAQATLGAAKMVLESGEHPGKLKDNVCSPGGTTIDAVDELERGGLRAAVLRAMEACARKNEILEQRSKK